MNKEDFIKELSKRINYSEEQCELINEILEKNFVISKKSKGPILAEFVSQLGVSEEEASRVYDTSVKIIKEEVKNKLKHPFKNQD